MINVIVSILSINLYFQLDICCRTIVLRAQAQCNCSNSPRVHSCKCCLNHWLIVKRSISFGIGNVHTRKPVHKPSSKIPQNPWVFSSASCNPHEWLRSVLDTLPPYDSVYQRKTPLSQTSLRTIRNYPADLWEIHCIILPLHSLLSTHSNRSILAHWPRLYL